MKVSILPNLSACLKQMCMGFVQRNEMRDLWAKTRREIRTRSSISCHLFRSDKHSHEWAMRNIPKIHWTLTLIEQYHIVAIGHPINICLYFDYSVYFSLSFCCWTTAQNNVYAQFNQNTRCEHKNANEFVRKLRSFSVLHNFLFKSNIYTKFIVYTHEA